MTLPFVFLAIFLVGFVIAVVGGLVRRILNPASLCDGVVVPAHEHWAGMKTPRSDFFVSFITVFGLVALILDGTTPTPPLRTVLVAAAVGLLGSIVLRAWMCRACDPQRGLKCCGAEATVIKAIPEGGFGQVEVDVGGCTVKLAARTISSESIPAGTPVTIVSRHESVVIVEVKA
ncbi:MAG TPA: hypothetical protein ENK19_02425 [Acidobacteria bacterium]|nr:hypothetical protein [Acidobacteriota bacterium]